MEKIVHDGKVYLTASDLIAELEKKIPFTLTYPVSWPVAGDMPANPFRFDTCLRQVLNIIEHVANNSREVKTDKPTCGCAACLARGDGLSIDIDGAGFVVESISGEALSAGELRALAALMNAQADEIEGAGGCPSCNVSDQSIYEQVKAKLACVTAYVLDSPFFMRQSPDERAAILREKAAYEELAAVLERNLGL